ncbi:hypothetical protein SDC9_133664 [bioreactor metagenome]|uniref:Uncharacterized protein n=1 Tax=bioreactor metagenome TaxID=1076179 RepID=A0A645DBL2_9ZZZZ
MDIRIDAAARQTKLQRLQTQIGILQKNVGREIADRQAAAMFNTPSFKAHIGIHHVPFVRFEAVIRQYFVRGLYALLALFLFRTLRFFCAFTGIDADQRS